MVEVNQSRLPPSWCRAFESCGKGDFYDGTPAGCPRDGTENDAAFEEYGQCLQGRMTGPEGILPCFVFASLLVWKN